jgi:hypothetical protein
MIKDNPFHPANIAAHAEAISAGRSIPRRVSIEDNPFQYSPPPMRPFEDDKADFIKIAAKSAGYPDGNPKTAVGAVKVPFNAIPVTALIPMGQAMADGLKKYGITNWRDSPVSASVYYNAILRHLFAWQDGEDVAPDSEVHHLGHVMACCAILLDARSLGVLNDDRPTSTGDFSRIATEYAETGKTSLAPR